MGDGTFASDLGEADLSTVLRTPAVSSRLGEWACADVQVAFLGKRTYQVSGSQGDFIIRLAADAAHLAVLRKEESVQRGLRGRVALAIPDTRVIDDVDGCPAFAIHRLIPGQPLTSDVYARMSPAARDRLAMDLATFFQQTHCIPLALACTWLGLPCDEDDAVGRLATAYGKPVWFGPGAVAQLRVALAPVLDAGQRGLYEDTVGRFAALPAEPGNMVFGHGDMHGYNMAMGEDALGPRLAGAFDLGCAWILDVHEDLFRLSLIGEELLERVVGRYQDLTGHARPLRRDRIAIYYRAFLFYLMAEQTGDDLDHLRELLREHTKYYGARYGQLS